jgi:hypothetical protein
VYRTCFVGRREKVLSKGLYREVIGDGELRRRGKRWVVSVRCCGVVGVFWGGGESVCVDR